MSSNDAEVFSRPQQEARIHDFEHFTLWADTPDRPGFRARMSFGERNGAPRITVFPNLEEGPKVLYVGMDPMVFDEFLNRFEKIVRGEPGKNDKIENLDRPPSSEPGSEPLPRVVRNTLWFGKNQDGVIWIGIEQANSKNIKFKILPSAWHRFYKEDGTQVTQEEGSVAQALSLSRCLREAVSRFTSRLRPYVERNNTQGGKKPSAPKTDSTTMASLGDDLPY